MCVCVKSGQSQKNLTFCLVSLSTSPQKATRKHTHTHTHTRRGLLAEVDEGLLPRAEARRLGQRQCEEAPHALLVSRLRMDAVGAIAWEVKWKPNGKPKGDLKPGNSRPLHFSKQTERKLKREVYPMRNEHSAHEN